MQKKQLIRNITTEPLQSHESELKAPNADKILLPSTGIGTIIALYMDKEIIVFIKREVKT